MKTRYRVFVEERYAKWVKVCVEDVNLIDDEIATMEESGEIKIDPGTDFREWNILAHEEDTYSSSEIEAVKKWCRDMVSAAEIFDSEWVREEMDEFQCQDWFEQMRDRGIGIPVEVTSCDLLDAVLETRKRSDKNV